MLFKLVSVTSCSAAHVQLKEGFQRYGRQLLCDLEHLYQVRPISSFLQRHQPQPSQSILIPQLPHLRYHTSESVLHPLLQILVFSIMWRPHCRAVLQMRSYQAPIQLLLHHHILSPTTPAPSHPKHGTRHALETQTEDEIPPEKNIP